MIKCFTKTEIGNIVDLLESTDNSDRKLGIEILKRDAWHMSNITRTGLYMLIEIFIIYTLLKWGDDVFGATNGWRVFQVIIGALATIFLIMSLSENWKKDD